MRLLIDSVLLWSGGALQLRDELAPALARLAPPGSEVVLLAAEGTPLPKASGLTTVPVVRPRGGWIGRWWWYNRRLPELLKRHGADAAYFFTGIVPPGVPKLLPSVTNFNNMIPFTPEETSRLPLFSRQRMRNALLRRLYVDGVRRAHVVVLHSRHALEKVSAHAGDIAHKTVVVLTGVPRDVDPAAAARTVHPRGGRPYFLYLSTFQPYKNQLEVVDAYAERARRDPGLPDLLLAGFPTDRRYFGRVRRRIARHALGPRIEYVGVVPRASISAWVHHATVNIFASTCETNPVTVAEILGVAGVLASSRTPPMPEIAADAAAYFDATSAASIGEILVTLHRNADQRTELRAAAARRAEALSWDVCAEGIWRAAERARAVHARGQH